MTTAHLIDADLIIDAGWVLPIAPENKVLAQHSLVLQGTQILALGPTANIHQRYRGQRQLALPGHLLMPGLVNAHGHAAMSLLRGLADDLPLERWLNDLIWPTEARWVSEAFVADGTRLALAEMLRTGTTCFSDMYFFPEVSARIAQEAGMRAQILFPLIQFPNAWSAHIDEGLEKGLRLHDSLRDDPLIRVGFGPHAPYTVPPDSLQRILTLADELDLQIQTHLHETAAEVAQAKAQQGLSHIRQFARQGLLVPRLQAVHMTQLDAEELALVAEANVAVVHCPQSNLKLGSGFCPLTKLWAAGVRVGLGTDGAASNDSLDMFTEMRAAALLAKGLAQDPAACSALQILAMATLGGAQVLDLAHRIGSLEPGKDADLIAVDMDHLDNLPVHEPASLLVYTNAGSRVTHAWVRGRALLADGQLLQLDAARLAQQSRDWGLRIQQSLHPS